MNSLDDRHNCMKDRTADRSTIGERPRRKYLPPVLVVYGTLAELTSFVGNDSFDGAIGSRQTS